MTDRSSTARKLLAALMCTVVLAVVGATGPAGATGSATGSNEHAIKGVVGSLERDPSCPKDPEFTNGVNQRQVLVGIAWTNIGPVGLKLDVCWIFVGAMGGMKVEGSFALLSIAGTLKGSVKGSVGFYANDDYYLVLTVERGSFLLRHVTGTLAFAVNFGGNPYTGTLTPDLSFFHHPVRL